LILDRFSINCGSFSKQDFQGGQARKNLSLSKWSIHDWQPVVRIRKVIGLNGIWNCLNLIGFRLESISKYILDFFLCGMMLLQVNSSGKETKRQNSD